MMMKNKMFWKPYTSEDTVVVPCQMSKVWEPKNCRAKWIGEGSIVGAFCDIGADVEIGRNCLIQSSCLISNGTIIGDETFLGPGVNILNDRYMVGCIQPSIIGNRVHIGGGVIINPDVVIGDDVFICSGALITNDVPAGTRVLPGDVKGRVVWQMVDEKKHPVVKLYWNQTNTTFDKTISVEAETLDEAKDAFTFVKKEMKVE